MIRVTRVSAYTDRFRKYEIYIDDLLRGHIKNKETKEFPVENGTHIIYAKIDWCRSSELEIDVDGSVVDVEVGPSLQGAKHLIPLNEIVHITALKDEYLWIKKKDDFTK